MEKVNLTIEDYDQIFKWTSIGNIGVSSNTMLFAVTEKSVYGESRDIPGDWADFKRCILLVNAVDIVKENLTKVAEVYPKWIPIIREWDYLVEAWEKQEGFYDILNSLRDECYECDGYIQVGPGCWRKSKPENQGK